MEFHSSSTIYSQLAERIKKEILSGELKPGAKLPSVREMGIQVNVNPNTVQRTYHELEEMKIVETKRGQGTFVTEDHLALTDMREQLKHEEIGEFVKGMQALGYSETEIEEGLKFFLANKKGDDIT